MCESTGVVVAPYTDFPQLLSVLLRMLGEGGEMAVKRDLLRLLGILGALDPHQHKARRLQVQTPPGIRFRAGHATCSKWSSRAASWCHMQVAVLPL